MTEILFYHLERATLENVLTGLLEKTLQRDWKAVVRAKSRDRLEALDNHLWTYRDETFLPHGIEGKGAAHPVWLTTGDDMPNAPQLLFLVDGAEADPTEISDLERCVMIFDGNDEPSVMRAREFWKATAAMGHDVTYWKQSDSDRWEKQG